MYCTPPTHLLTAITNHMTVSQLKSRSSKKCQHGATRKDDYAYALLLSLVNGNKTIQDSPRLTKGAKDAVATNTKLAEKELNELCATAAHPDVDTWSDLKRSLPTTPSPTCRRNTHNATLLLTAVTTHMNVKQMKSRTSKSCHHQAKLKEDYAYSLLLAMSTCDTVDSAFRKVTAAVKASLGNITDGDFAELKKMTKDCETWMDLKNLMTRGTSDLDNLAIAPQHTATVFTMDEQRRAQKCTAALERAVSAASNQVEKLQRASVHHHAATKQKEQLLRKQHQHTQRTLAYELAQQTQKAEQLAHRLNELKTLERRKEKTNRDQEKWTRRYQEVLKKQLNPLQFNQELAPLELRPVVSRRVSATARKKVTRAPNPRVSVPVASTTRGLLKHQNKSVATECKEIFFSISTFSLMFLVFATILVSIGSEGGVPSASLQLDGTAGLGSLSSGQIVLSV